MKAVRQYAAAMALTLAAAATGIFIGALPAQAADEDSPYAFSDFAIPNPNRGDTSRLLLTIDTSDHNGETCTVNVSTANGPSVHPENFVTLEGGIPTVTVTGTEDAANGTHQNTTTVVAGDTLEVWNHFSLATSVDGEVSIECQRTTTTTASPSTTTSTSTPTTSSSSLPSTTTTTSGVTTTTTGTPSTEPPATSTTGPSTSSTSVPPVTTTPDQSTLPFTSDYSREQAGAAVALVALGALTLYALRSRGGRHEA